MGSCNGNCAACSGCARELTLSEPELRLLEQLGQIAFLPIARKMGDPAPVYLEEDTHSPEEFSLILQCLEKKGLISLDFDRPLKNFDPAAYADYPIRGSMALTARGQSVLELMELQGIGGEEI